MSSKKFQNGPDFLVIGAGKSGTTSLDKYLGQHPEIFMSKVKEPNFFGYESMSRRDFADRPEELAHFDGSVTNIEDYLKLFSNAKPDQLKGETSNTYMYHEQAPFRIKYYIPDVKLIAILRQPAARLYSRFLHLAREDRTPTPNFDDCLNKNTIWWERNDLIKEGFYGRYLARYYQLFPAENIRVYLYEDLQQSPLEVMKSLYGYLNVDAAFTPDVGLRYNESGIVKNRFLNQLYGPGGFVSRSIKKILPQGAMDKLKENLGFQKRILALRGKNLHRPRLDPEIKRRLTHEVYGDDIKQLETIIGRDLSHWLNMRD